MIPGPTEGIRRRRSSTRARARVIAVQAIVVCALMVIVFLTILRPDEENPLVSVQAPEGTEQTEDTDGDDGDQELGDDDGPEGDGENNGGPGQGNGNGNGDMADGPGGPGGDSEGGGGKGDDEDATGVIPPPAPPLGSGSDDGIDSPTGDQYSDTVARLIGRLHPPS